MQDQSILSLSDVELIIKYLEKKDEKIFKIIY